MIKLIEEFIEWLVAMSRMSLLPGRSCDLVTYCLKTSGYEKWFQFNFAAFLQNKYPEMRVETEDPPPTDAPGYKRRNIDIGIYPREVTYPCYVDYIELKCYTDFMNTGGLKKFISRYLEDVKKTEEMFRWPHNGSWVFAGTRYAVAIAVFDIESQNSLINTFVPPQCNYGGTFMYNWIVRTFVNDGNGPSFRFEIIVYEILPSISAI